MKNLNLNLVKTFVVAVTLILSGNTFAEEGGNSGGGGGFAVYCRDEGNINLPTSTSLADLWLAENGRGPFRKTGKLSLMKVAPNESVSSVISKVVKRAKAINASAGLTLEQMVKEVSQQIEFVIGERIVAENDTDIVSVPNNCLVLGVARYSDIQEYLTVSKELYSELSVRDRAALIIHEALYRIKRISARVTTSYSTQYEVGLLFAENAPVGVDLSTIESAMLCSQTNGPSAFVIGIAKALGGGVEQWSFDYSADQRFSFQPAPIGVGGNLESIVPGNDDQFAIYRKAVAEGKVNDLVNHKNYGRIGGNDVPFNCVEAK